MDKILILDFGGQYKQLIARRVRECNVYCEIHPYTLEIEKIKEHKNDFLIPINLEEIKVLNPCKAFIFYMCMMLIISLGIISLLLQIYPVNFFNIKIEKSE